MEDQVITPKSKFDSMERELKTLREEVDTKTVRVVFKTHIERMHYRYQTDFHTDEVTYKIGNQDHLSENIKNQLNLYVQVVNKIVEEFEENKKSVQVELDSMEVELSKKRDEITKFEEKVNSYPRWVKWVLNI